jgi:hypothetical protein
MARSKMGRRGSVESPAAVPVQTVRYRAPPELQAAPAGGVARQRPGCGGAGGGGWGRRRWGALA